MKPIWDRLNVGLLVTQFVAWLPSLFSAALILLGFWAFYRVTRAAITRLLHRTHFEPALMGMVIGVYRFTVFAFGIIMAASQLGINVGAALAGLGVVGLTIGFAAKDSLSNIMAGFLIFWDKPFHVGDWVTLSDYHGRVGEITMRTTRLQTRDNTWVIIPNESVINKVLVNHSTRGITRLQVPVGIAYAASISQARQVIEDALARLALILKDPASQIVIHDLGSSSVNLLVFAWIEDAKDEKPAFFAVMETVKLALDEAGISIPFNQVDLSIVSVRDEVWEKASQLSLLPPPNQIPNGDERS